MLTDRPSLRLFLSEAVRRPLQIGALWPSSISLGRAMAGYVPIGDAPVLELGPGTGIVTAELLAVGISPEKIVAVEKSPRLVEHLDSLFPRCRIIAGDALELSHLLGSQKFGAVISSLPLKVFSPRQVETLSQQIQEVLLPGAPWIQFSYDIVNDHPPEAFLSVDSKIVWSNFPPAKVSVFRAGGLEAFSEN